MVLVCHGLVRFEGFWFVVVLATSSGWVCHGVVWREVPLLAVLVVMVLSASGVLVCHGMNCLLKGFGLMALSASIYNCLELCLPASWGHGGVGFWFVKVLWVTEGLSRCCPFLGAWVVRYCPLLGFLVRCLSASRIFGI